MQRRLAPRICRAQCFYAMQSDTGCMWPPQLKRCIDRLRLHCATKHRPTVAALLSPAELVHELVDSPALAR